MKALGWKTYRTRFLVNAKQLSSNLSFIDHLGRQHCGRKGDYLVESSDGVISIAPRQIFEDIYVPMLPYQDSIGGESVIQDTQDNFSFDGVRRICQLRVEPLKIERMKHQRRNYSSIIPPMPPDGCSRLRRKSPQPAQSSASRLGMM